MSTPRLWIRRAVLDALVAEANRAGPNETGGVLLGYWGGADDEPVVVEAVGPGPGARHEADRFVPDHDYQEGAIDRHYRDSGRRVAYLGDWHTHPGGVAYLSDRDLQTIDTIAAAPAARAPRPLMMVLAPGPEWEVKVWVGIYRRTWYRRPRRSLKALTVCVFE